LHHSNVFEENQKFFSHVTDSLYAEAYYSIGTFLVRHLGHFAYEAIDERKNDRPGLIWR